MQYQQRFISEERNNHGLYWQSEGRTLKVDVIDRDKEVLIKAELPGGNKDDLDISVSDNPKIISWTC